MAAIIESLTNNVPIKDSVSAKLTLPFSGPDGIQIRIYSLTDQQFTLLMPNTEDESVLDVKLKWKKYGGFDEFEITLSRDVNFLLFSGIRLDFYFNGTLWFTGYTEYVPSQDQDSEKITIKGKGFYKRFSEIIINETYSSQTLSSIIEDIANTYFDSIDINYDAYNVNVPNIDITTLEFKDKSLDKVFETINNICNYNYLEEHFYWGVDEYRYFYIKKVVVSDRTVDQLFEGYDFQKPESKLDDSKIKNKILAYRTVSGSPSDSQYVATYSDVSSINKFGEKSRKLTFPDYIDTDTITNICDGLIEAKKEPLKRVSIENYKKQRKLEYGYYGINSRIKNYKRELYDGSSTDLWDTSGASITTIESSEDIVFTGRESLKITTSVGSAGEYIDLDLNEPIWFPQNVEILLYMEDEIANIQIEVFDTEGSSVSFIYGVTEPNLIANDSGTEDNLTANDAGTSDNLVSHSLDTNDIINQWLVRKVDVEGTLLNLSKIRITFNIDRSLTFYVDRIITNFKHWWYNKVSLEEVEYNFSNNIVLSKATFGDVADSIYDEIKDKIKEGNVAFDIFSKQ